MLPRRWIAPALGCLFVFAFGSATHAQDSSLLRRWFVTGSILGSQARPITFEDRGAHFTGWDIAAGAGVGNFLAERWSLRAEIEVPRRGQTETVVAPPQLPPLRITYWSRQEVVRRHVTVAALLGFHRRSGRVRPALLAGATIARVSSEQTYLELFHAGSAWRTASSSRSSGTHAGFITGIDLETRVTTALALVAQARLSVVARGNDTADHVGDGDAGIGRLGAGVRWTF